MKTRQGEAIGQVRIIAGKWGNTRLAVPSRVGLRPSSDRMRETLFNWLQPVISGAAVLDVFAGSGALGIEALSRGAASAVMIERDAQLVRGLKSTLNKLQGGEAATLLLGDAVQSLPRQRRASFDIAFVDPPFSATLWPLVWSSLDACMKVDSWMYVESPPCAPEAVPPNHWQLHRETRSRDACGRLYRRSSAN